MEFSAKQIAAFIKGKSLERKRYSTFAKIEEECPEQFLSCQSQIYTLHLRDTIKHCPG